MEQQKYWNFTTLHCCL